MKILAKNRSEQNEAAMDPWTVVHFAAGLALGLTRAPASWVAAGAVAYELVEQVLERRELGEELFHVAGPESPANVVVDLAVLAGGYWLGERWSDGRG